MNEIKEYTEKVFEDIKHIDDNGNEYWLARELVPLLEYSKWERFSNTINNAKIACENSGYNVNDHFPRVGKLISIGKGGKRKVDDYKLSRYACYLIAQNGDSRKKPIALAQTYFAIQTRKQELNEKEYNEYTANLVHYKIGKIVRKAIKEAGGTMPEDLPTPNKSLKELEKESKKVKE
ncbi:MAG: DNA replication protein DnaD [Bacilli bacterium]|nr:DNA replication protein DnaD [Bacilli bacterium]